MDDSSQSADMPHLYREVLDALARLERAGQRAAAYDIRRRAYRVYATRWDESGRRSLAKLVREAHGRLAAEPRGDTVPSLSGTVEPA
jgi:hypothetical protein